MRTMVPHGKDRLKALERFVLATATVYKSAFKISDVKADGSVFVRFRSSEVCSAITIAEAFRDALKGHGLWFVQTDDNQFRVGLSQFV